LAYILVRCNYCMITSNYTQFLAAICLFKAINIVILSDWNELRLLKGDLEIYLTIVVTAL